MKPFPSLSFAIVLAGLTSTPAVFAAASGDWPGWRGPTADGHAAAGQKVPVTWSETQNVVWKASIRGKGHASPTVVGNRIYLATADHATDEQLVICYDRSNGKVVWETVVHGSIVLVTADHRGGGAVVALNSRTGEIKWQHERPKIANYASPAVIKAGGKTQVVVAGCNLVSSYDPESGKKLWEIEGSTEETVVTAVTDGSRIFVGGGYPKNHTVAIEADGSGRVAWQNGTKVYVPSMLVKDSHVYAILDAGQAVCWKSDTGEELWREKIDRDFYGSPVMVGNRIYATSMAGVTSVFEATPQGGKLLAQNRLGDESFSSPSICGNRLYLRSAKKGEPRQDFLWCIGE